MFLNTFEYLRLIDNILPKVVYRYYNWYAPIVCRKHEHACQNMQEWTFTPAMSMKYKQSVSKLRQTSFDFRNLQITS